MLAGEILEQFLTAYNLYGAEVRILRLLNELLLDSQVDTMQPRCARERNMTKYHLKGVKKVQLPFVDQDNKRFRVRDPPDLNITSESHVTQT